MDIWLKRVWLVNGVILLVGLVIALGFAGSAIVSDRRGDKATAVAAPSAEGSADADRGGRAVRFELPETIHGSTTQIVLVHNGADYTPVVAGSGSSSRKEYAQSGDGPIVNVAFLPANGVPGHLLFSGPAYIVDVTRPGESYAHADSLQTWISYEVVLDDTDGDGSLNESDEHALFVTDLDGNNLRRVLPPGFRLKDYGSLGNHKTLMVTALELAKNNSASFDIHKARERAFLYDVATGKLESFAALDSLVVRAGNVMSARAPGGRSR
jgi:hypothetical protein